jgi:hypothetical protein
MTLSGVTLPERTQVRSKEKLEKFLAVLFCHYLATLVTRRGNNRYGPLTTPSHSIW